MTPAVSTSPPARTPCKPWSGKKGLAFWGLVVYNDVEPEVRFLIFVLRSKAQNLTGASSGVRDLCLGRLPILWVIRVAGIQSFRAPKPRDR